MNSGKSRKVNEEEEEGKLQHFFFFFGVAAEKRVAESDGISKGSGQVY